MSLRDEIAKTIAEHLYTLDWDKITDRDREGFLEDADALLPIVERAVRQSVDQAAAKFPEIIASGRMGWLCGLTDDEKDAIVARVMEGGK